METIIFGIIFACIYAFMRLITWFVIRFAEVSTIIYIALIISILIKKLCDYFK